LPDYEPFKTHPLLAAPLAVTCRTFNFWLFNSIQHSPSREGNGSSASQKISCTFGSPKVHYRIQISPSFLPILNHKDAFYTLIYHLRYSSILYSNLRQGILKLHFPSGVPAQFHFCIMCYLLRPFHLSRFIIITINDYYLCICY